jgi:hypothetical protein
MISLPEAAAIAGIEEPMLPTDVACSWHVCESHDGELLVCLDSLIDSL